MADAEVVEEVPDQLKVAKAPAAAGAAKEEGASDSSEDESLGEAGSDHDSEDDSPEWDENGDVAEQLIGLSYSEIKIVNCDFLSEFGAAEPFLIDGDALVASVLTNPLLDLSKGIQTLHVVHTVESILSNLAVRGANFGVFFFKGNTVFWQRMGAIAAAARETVLQHLLLVNKQLGMQGKPAAVRLHVVPGTWWAENDEWKKVMAVEGPAYVMTDFGWSGTKDPAVLDVTRGFVHRLHMDHHQVVTIEDLEMDGSHTMSNNMQPPLKPGSRAKFAFALQKVLAMHASALAAENSFAAPPVEAAAGLDVRDMLCVAAVKQAVASGAGGDKALDLGAVFALCLSLSKNIPLAERAFPIPQDAWDAWSAGAWATASADFLSKVALGVAAALGSDAGCAALQGAVAKDTSMTLADSIDSRLFAVVLARSLAGSMKMTPDQSAAAQKILALVAPGDARVAGKKPQSASDADVESGKALVDAIAAKAVANRLPPPKSLLPLDGKQLLSVVCQGVSERMSDMEDTSFDHNKHQLGQFRDRRYKDVEPLGDDPDPYSYKVVDDVIVIRKVNKWNSSSRQAQLKARYSSGYIDSLLLGTPLKRQVIAQPMTAEDFERRRVTSLERIAEDAEQDRRAARRGGEAAAPRPESAKPGKEKKEKKGVSGKGQAASGKAEAIKAEAEKKRLEKTEAAKMAQLEHVKKNAPKELKTETEALIKHLEELRVCAQKCMDDGAVTIALEAELTALRHVLDACKRDKKDELLLQRHLKRGFVVLQRLLVNCRAHVVGAQAEEAADAASSFGFTDLAEAIAEIAKDNGGGGAAKGGDKDKDKKDKKDKKEKKDKKDDDKESSKKSKKSIQLPEQSSIRYQVALAAEYLRRPAGVEGDERVPFKPDDWQRKLLDIVDSGNSALIVAPTASGKTFIAYYVMEMCLRANDTDVVVYVAPTSALVDQVYHEIQARYTKRYTGDMHMTGIFNTSYREDHLKCQILVAEPECLEIMLLDPANADWVKKIRHIIFDEVHSVGMTGGEVWERMLLYTSAPFLGLSATLGDVERFRDWLQKVEKQRGRELYFVNYTERHNDLCPYLFTERESFDDQLVAMHPCWAIYKKLTPDTRFVFPSDFKLLPEHCVVLHDAMVKFDDSKDLKDLTPETYFKRVPDPAFNISMRDARKWEQEIKNRFCLMDYDVQRKVLDDIIKPSQDACTYVEGQLVEKSERQYLNATMLPMIRTLAKANMLPCIVFHMIRDNCVKYAKEMTKQLKAEEEEQHAKDGHADKVAKQEKKLEGLNKSLEKMGYSRDKADDDDMTDEVKEALQELVMAEAKLQKLKAVDPRFALIPPGQTQVTPDEIEDMVSSGHRKKFFNAKDPLHQALLRGIGAHHAGMPRKYRMAVERLFRMKRLSVVIATETLAMGINMPTKTSVFAGDSIFLNAMNFRQMAGRSGRRGFDLRGNIVFAGVRKDKIQRLLNSELPTLSGNLLLTSSFGLRMLIKHASIRTQQEADVMEQTRKVESFIDKIEDTVKPLLEEWRSDKNISVEEEQSLSMAGMATKDRADMLLERRKEALRHINSRDLASALLDMPEAQRKPLLMEIIDERSTKLKQAVDLAVQDVGFGVAATKKLLEIVEKSAGQAAETPAMVADRERINDIRDHNAKACARVLKTPLFTPTGDLMAAQYAHSFRFACEYMQREGLLDAYAAPRDTACIIAALFNAEPANFGAVNLLRSRLLEKICQRWVEKSDGSQDMIPDKTELSVVEHLINIFCHFFARVQLPAWHAEYAAKNTNKLGGAQVLLGPLDPQVQEVIDVHVKSALAAAVDYYRSFVIKFSKEMGEDNVLPISGAAWPASTEQPVCPPLADLSVATVLRSRFVAISGRGDAPSDYMSIREFCDTVRKNLFVDPHMIPAFELKPRLNSYVLDFWRLHNYRTILRSNKISENHAWGFLKHFALQVKGVFKSLDRRSKYAPYKRGIHGEGRNLETVFSDPQVHVAFDQLTKDFGEKFMLIAKEQDHS